MPMLKDCWPRASTLQYKFTPSKTSTNLHQLRETCNNLVNFPLFWFSSVPLRDLSTDNSRQHRFETYRRTILVSTAATPIDGQFSSALLRDLSTDNSREHRYETYRRTILVSTATRPIDGQFSWAPLRDLSTDINIDNEWLQNIVFVPIHGKHETNNIILLT